MCKVLSHASQSLHSPSFWCLSSKRHFGTLTLKFLLNPITKETMTNLQNTVKRLKHCHKPFIFISSFSSSYFVLSMIVTFFSFYCEILAEPYYGPKDNQFPKHSQTPQNNPSLLAFLAYHQSFNLKPSG